MFQTILIGLSIVVLTAIGYVLFKAWRKGNERQETFQASLQQVPPAALAPIPAPAPPVVAQIAEEPPRVVAPAGPNPPSAAPPKKVVTFTPEAEARDPFDELNGENPVKDSLRHPERSFGPGVENMGTNVSRDAGVSADSVRSGVATFSPEFAQNGGEFLNGVGANDMSVDTWATA